MATWKGDPKKFKVEYTSKDALEHGIYDPSCGEVVFRWEYGTSLDTLSIHAEHPDMKSHVEFMGPDWAEAQLYTLANYYAIYVGREELKELLKDLLEE